MVFYLRKEFMLTAGYGKYYFAVPFYSVNEREVCGGVTCVESDDHIGSVTLVVCNVSCDEMQIVIFQLSGCVTAEVYDILFQIETYNLHITVFLNFEVVIKRKGKITFSAPEIYDPKGSLIRKIIKTVIGYFKKSVYLSEL